MTRTPLLPGKCAVAGSYTDNVPRNQAYIDADLGNGWGSAQGIDGITNSPRAGAGTVSCPQDGGCVAGGFFDDAAGRTQAPSSRR